MTAIDLSTIPIGHGRGTVDKPCTIAAINLAITGTLTDDDPTGCMSDVVRRWVIAVQDSMLVEMLAPDDEHGRRWRQVAPLIAGSKTAGPSDAERVELILAWMWDRLAWRWETWVPASAHGVWRRMLDERTAKAARDAATAAYAAATAAAATYAATAATAAAAATGTYATGTYATDAACDAVVAVVAVVAVRAEFWRDADPASLLAQLVGAPS